MINAPQQAHHTMTMEEVEASIVIPTFNGAARICKCLDALIVEIGGRAIEILVVDDGSTDSIAETLSRYPTARLISQLNAGPATARNRGALEARGGLLLFTDDDCVPAPGWLDAMLAPFADPEVVGAKGVYRTDQRSLIARFVQIEYEDKYRLMADVSSIDFIDTYSAAFRRDRFLEMDGYDTSFPVACAEDIELSYRMSARGWTMKFAPKAIVFHTHPDTLAKYLKKKYKFAFWRVLAVRKNPSKALKDSHTPQIMKLQLLLPPALLVAGLVDINLRLRFSVTALTGACFLMSTISFVMSASRTDLMAGLFSPLLLAFRASAQFAGVTAGLLRAPVDPAGNGVHLPG